MRPTPYVASLRVYEPLSAFNPVDRLRWQSIDIDAQSFIAEEKFAMQRTVVPEPPAGRPDGVHILEKDGQRYVAPWSTATRCWAAFDNFKDSLPSTVVRLSSMLAAFSNNSPAKWIEVPLPGEP